MTTTKCEGCSTETFVGDRIRHAHDCPVAAAASAEKRARLAARSCGKRAAAQALTVCEDPSLAAKLRSDYDDHDK